MQSPKTGYTQAEKIAATLTQRITAGQVQRGERLASEHSLAQEFNASRGTIRRALAMLQESDLVHTRAGSGSYVAFHGVDLSGPQGWTAATATVGLPTSTEVLSVDLIDTPDEVAGCCTEPQCYRIKRVRTLHGAPLSLEISTLPANDRIRAVLEHGLLGGSVSTTLRATGMKVTHGRQEVSAARLRAGEAALLRMPIDARVIITQRLGLDSDDQLVEYVESWLDPDHFTLHFDFEE